jgi:hypothetical protein
MCTLRLSCAALLVMFGSWALGVGAEPPAEPAKAKLSDKDWAKAEKAVKAHLAKAGGPGALVSPLKDAALGKSVPGHAFFGVAFRQYPIARPTPAGLSAANVFAVGPDKKVQVFADVKGAEKFFKGKLPARTTETQLKDAARAWLVLAEQFHQDGFYQFEVMDDATKASRGKAGSTASAKSVVMRGGSGTFGVELTFNAGGKLTGTREDNKLRPGPRPRCQATKLLDADPVVRKMAEQDLLIMGRAAKGYLDEQRAKASPELRRAIDRLWKRILDEDR